MSVGVLHDQVGRQNTLGRGTSLPARLKQMVGERKRKASTVLQSSRTAAIGSSSGLCFCTPGCSRNTTEQWQALVSDKWATMGPCRSRLNKLSSSGQTLGYRIIAKNMVWPVLSVEIVQRVEYVWGGHSPPFTKVHLQQETRSFTGCYYVDQEPPSLGNMAFSRSWRRPFLDLFFSLSFLYPRS